PLHPLRRRVLDRHARRRNRPARPALDALHRLRRRRRRVGGDRAVPAARHAAGADQGPLPAGLAEVRAAVSHEPSHATEHMSPPPVQAEEGIQWGPVLAAGIGSVVVFAIAILIVLRMLHAREKALQPLGPDPMPLQMGQTEIGIVDQTPFDVTRALQAYRADRLQRLETWGWVDRK